MPRKRSPPKPIAEGFTPLPAEEDRNLIEKARALVEAAVDAGEIKAGKEAASLLKLLRGEQQVVLRTVKLDAAVADAIVKMASQRFGPGSRLKGRIKEAQDAGEDL